MTRVLMVSAYASVRAGLHAFLNDTSDIEIVADASGSAELERLLPEVQAEVVLVDDLPDDRARLLGLLASSETAVVLLGESREGYRDLVGLPLPGWAYLLKEADGPEIVGAIRAASAGLVALDRSLVPWSGHNAGHNAGHDDGPKRLSDTTLTAREREVLALMARGLPNKQIAARLSISLHTVKFHVASILSKLGAASRTEAVMLGARQGAVSF